MELRKEFARSCFWLGTFLVLSAVGAAASDAYEMVVYDINGDLPPITRPYEDARTLTNKALTYGVLEIAGVGLMSLGRKLEHRKPS